MRSVKVGGGQLYAPLKVKFIKSLILTLKGEALIPGVKALKSTIEALNIELSFDEIVKGGGGQLYARLKVKFIKSLILTLKGEALIPGVKALKSTIEALNIELSLDEIGKGGGATVQPAPPPQEI